MSTITTTQLQQQYIAYFGRPGDPAGIKYWLASGLTETEFAAKIYAQDEYKKSTVGDKSTEEQVNNLYVNLFGRSADAEGLLYWTGEVDAGRKSLSSLAVDLIWSASDADNKATTQGAADSAALTAKVNSATLFTADVEADAAAILAYQAEVESGDDFKAGAAFGSAKTWLATITTTDATAAGVDTAVANMTSASTTTTGTTSSLTTSVDALSGGAYNDTFNASEATLTAGDTIAGGSGTDTLRYTATGAAAVTETGFTTTSVETLKLQSDATGGTTFTATGSTDVSKIINTLSTTDLTVDGVKALATVELDTVRAGDTQVKFDSALVTGSSDAVTVNLKSNTTAADAAIGTLTVGNTAGTGFETVNIVTSGGESKLTAITSGAATVNISGDQNLTLSNALASATTIDATSFTGKLDIVADSAGTAKDVVVTGGTGDDTVDFTAGFEASDKFTGGDGADTIKLTQAVASGAINGTLTGVEQLGVSDAGTGVIDMDSFSGITKVIYDAGIAANGTATVDDAVTGITVEVDAAQLVANDGSLTVDLKTDGSSDEVTVVIDAVGAGEGIATLNAADAETLTISVDDDTTDATGTFTFAGITSSDATKIVLSGDSEITISGITDPDTPILATLDASAATDKVVISAANFVKTGATITLGSADDTFTFATADGADVIDLSKGGSDEVIYTALAQSDDKTDTIKGFTSGDDDVNLTGLVGRNVTSSSQWAGVGASFSEAQGLLNGTKVAVFDSSTSTLWVDIDADSVLEGATDFRVKLDGVTTLLATDLSLDTGVEGTANQAAFNTGTKTHFTEGKKFTNEDDTLNTTVAQLAGSTIDGLQGTDTIAITGSGAASLLDANVTGGFTNFETVTVGSAVTTLTLAAADTGSTQLSTVTGASGYTQTLALATDDLTDVDLDNFTTITGSGTGATVLTMDTDNFDDVTTITLQDGLGVDGLTLADGTYDFSSVTITFADSGANVLDLNTDGDAAKTVTADAADLDNVDVITGETTAVVTTLNINDSDNLSGATVSNIDTITIGTASNTNQTLTLAGNDFGTAQFTTVTGSGDDNLTLAGNNAVTLVSATISGFDTISSAALTTAALTLDASAASYGTVTLTGHAGGDLSITETGDYSNLQTTAGEYDVVTVTAGTTVTLDAHQFSGDTVTLDGTSAAETAVITLKMRTAGALDLNAVAVGGIHEFASLAVTGTTGADTITATAAIDDDLLVTIDAGAGADTIIAHHDYSNLLVTTTTNGVKFTGGAGNDTFRLFDQSNKDTATSAQFDDLGIQILDFNADTEQVLVPDALTDLGNSVQEKASGTALDLSSGGGIYLITGAAASDLRNETQVIGAIGANITANGNSTDESIFVVKNAASTKFGVYYFDDDAGALAGSAVASADLDLLATVTYTGTLDTSSIGVY